MVGITAWIPAILNNYGHTLFLMGRVDDARNALQKVVDVQPYYAEGHYNLATLLEQIGQEEYALREYEHAASLKPGLPGINDRINELKKRVV